MSDGPLYVEIERRTWPRKYDYLERSQIDVKDEIKAIWHGDRAAGLDHPGQHHKVIATEGGTWNMAWWEDCDCGDVGVRQVDLRRQLTDLESVETHLQAAWWWVWRQIAVRANKPGVIVK